MTKQTKRQSTRGNKFQIDTTNAGVRIWTKLSKQNGFNVVDEEINAVSGKISFQHPHECLVDNDPDLLEYLTCFSIYQNHYGKNEYFMYECKTSKITGRLSRLIWQYYHRELPAYKRGGDSLTVDHLDGCKWNNKAENLCLMTSRMNLTKTRILNKNIYPHHIQCAVNPNDFSDYMLILHTGYLNLQQTIYFRYNDLSAFMFDLNRFKGKYVKERFTDLTMDIILGNSYIDMKDITREPSEKEQQNIICASSVANAYPRPNLKMNFEIFNKQ